MNNFKIKHELQNIQPTVFWFVLNPTLLELLQNEPVNQGQVLVLKFQISYHPVPSYVTRSELSLV